MDVRQVRSEQAVLLELLEQPAEARVVDVREDGQDQIPGEAEEVLVDVIAQGQPDQVRACGPEQAPDVVGGWLYRSSTSWSPNTGE